jgi:hypothetical protein
MAAQYDDDNLTAKFTNNGKEYEISCMGLSTEVVHRLVLVGAVSLLSNKRNPYEVWNRIKQGDFKRGRRKNLPKTVRAYALLKNMPETQVWEYWKGLSSEEKKELSQNREIRKAVIDLE